MKNCTAKLILILAFLIRIDAHAAAPSPSAAGSGQASGATTGHATSSASGIGPLAAGGTTPAAPIAEPSDSAGAPVAAAAGPSQAPTAPLPAPAPAAQPGPQPVPHETVPLATIAEYVRELRSDPSFGTPIQHDWEYSISSWQAAAAQGDPLAIAAVAAAPAYLSYQAQLQGRKALTDQEALQLYQLDLPLLNSKLPVDVAPLSDLEAISIQLYTGVTFAALSNDIQANHGKLKDLAVYASVLDSALAKLPAVDAIVYHVQDMSPQDLASLKQGKLIHYWYYISTSAEKIGWQGNTNLIIHTKTGKLIEKYSVNPQEHEILIGRGATFRVTKAPVLVEGVYNVEFEEVVAPPAPSNQWLPWFSH